MRPEVLFPNVDGVRAGPGSIEDLFCLHDLRRRSIHEQQNFIALHRRFILKNAVLGDADAVQARADRTQPAHNNRALERTDNPGDQRPGYQTRARGLESRRTPIRARASPDAAPEGAGLAPALHAVAGVVIPYDVLFGVIVLADNGQNMHVDSCALECFTASRPPDGYDTPLLLIRS